MSGTPPSIEREDTQKEEQVKQEEKKKRIAIFGIPEDPLEEPVLPDKEKPKYRPDQTDVIMERATELPFEIKAHEAKLFALTQKDDYINKRSAEIKERLYLNVSNEKSDGQPKYPDLQSQEKEALKRLQESKLWERKNAEIYSQVTSEEKVIMADDGKTEKERKKMFTSEAARKAETTTRLYADPEIKQLNQKYLMAVKDEKQEGRQTYTNEKAREIEVNNRLQEHAEYKLLMEEQKKNMAEISRTKSDIYCLRGEFKSIEIVTELMKLKLRII